MTAIITIEHDGQTQTINSDGLESLNDDVQRISDVYFARKRVASENDNLNVSFERINESVLGRTVYLVIVTNNMRGLEIDARIKPSDNTLTGNTDALTLVQHQQQVTLLNAMVGDYTALNNREDSHDHYTNLATLQDMAIIKVELRPQGRATFDTWANNVGTGTTTLKVEVKRKDNEAFARREEEEEAREPAIFLEDQAFSIANKNVYEIYHADNEYNRLEMNGTRRRQLGKIENGATTDVVYYYHTAWDNEEELATSTIEQVSGRSNGRKVQQLPAGYTHSTNAEGGEARTNYHYTDGSIVTEGVHSGSKYIKYSLSGTQVQLIRMPNSINRTIEGVLIAYTFSNTQRRYCHPDCFAGFMVVLSACRVALQSTGMCFSDASSYPSLSHPNGDSIDTIYLANRTNAQTVLTAFVDAGFSQVIAGTNYTWLTGAHLYKADHNNHLHSGNFSSDYVQILNA